MTPNDANFRVRRVFNDYTTGVCEAVCRCPGLSGGGGGTLNVLCAANARQLPHVASDDVHSAMKLKRTEH